MREGCQSKFIQCILIARTFDFWLIYSNSLSNADFLNGYIKHLFLFYFFEAWLQTRHSNFSAFGGVSRTINWIGFCFLKAKRKPWCENFTIKLYTICNLIQMVYFVGAKSTLWPCWHHVWTIWDSILEVFFVYVDWEGNY